MKKLNKIRVILVAVTIFCIINYYNVVIPKQELERNHKFIIGNIYEVKYQSEGGKSSYFEFIIKNKKFYGVTTIGSGYEDQYQTGSKLFVKFNPENPENCTVLIGVEIPKFLKNNETGWRNLPL